MCHVLHLYTIRFLECELQSDSKTIFEHLQRDPNFADTIQDQFDLSGAVGEALDAIHSDQW